MSKANSYSDSVFINCPFDREYQRLFRAIIFTAFDCGFVAHSAYEIGDDIRLMKILKIISGCRYSIHDLSRVKLDPRTKLPRFNMPFELGIVVGMKYSGKMKNSAFLVLEKKKFDYQKCISDIAGMDTKAHGNKVDEVISIVRDWLQKTSGRKNIPGSKAIIDRYKMYSKAHEKITTAAGLDPNNLSFIDYCHIVTNFLKAVESDRA